MTFEELVEKIKDQPPASYWIDPWDCDILEELGLFNIQGMESQVSTRLATRCAVSWICTDTGVGLDVLYLDGDAVALIFKRFRKISPDILWRDAKAKQAVFDYFISLIQPPENKEPRWVTDEKSIDAIFEWIDDYEFKDGYQSHV